MCPFRLLDDPEASILWDYWTDDRSRVSHYRAKFCRQTREWKFWSRLLTWSFFLNEHVCQHLFLDTGVAFCETIFACTFKLHSHELWKFIPRVLHYAIPMVPKLACGNTSVPAVSIISGRISRFKSRQRRRQLQFHFPTKGPHTRVLFRRRFRRWYRPRRPIKNVSAKQGASNLNVGRIEAARKCEFWLVVSSSEIDANRNDVKVKKNFCENYSQLCNSGCIYTHIKFNYNMKCNYIIFLYNIIKRKKFLISKNDHRTTLYILN